MHYTDISFKWCVAAWFIEMEVHVLITIVPMLLTTLIQYFYY
jgi:hypothetical protein